MISWCGLPTHPLIPFLAHSLRPAFRRVHVLVPPDSMTFETYILAAEFDPEGHPARPDPVVEFASASRPKGLVIELTKESLAESPATIAKFQFYDWLRSPLRSMSGYDDAVAWTLPLVGEVVWSFEPKAAASVGGRVRSPVPAEQEPRTPREQLQPAMGNRYQRERGSDAGVTGPGGSL